MNKTMQNAMIGGLIGVIIAEALMTKTPLGDFLK